VLIAALPALHELARAARSAEKLFDTLSRELPPTLEAIRLTGMEITNLTDDVNQNVQSAGRVVEQVDQSLSSMKQQARQAQVTTRSVVAGFRAAWQVLTNSPPANAARPRPTNSENRPSINPPVSNRAIHVSERANNLTENSFESILAETDSLEEQGRYTNPTLPYPAPPDAKPLGDLEPRRHPKDRLP
jgi:FtsZ-binding cell division protein ZapB